MKLTKCIITMLLYILLTIFSQPSFSNQALPNNEWNLTVGGALIASQSPWVDNETQTSMLPYFGANYNNWTFGVNNLIQYTSTLNNETTFSWHVKPRNNGFNPRYSLFRNWSKDSVFEGYKRPEIEYIVGSRYKYHWLSVGIEYDVSGRSKAVTGDITLTWPLYQRPGVITLEVSVSHYMMSENYSNYYYGINQSQENLNVGRQYYMTNDATANSALDMVMVLPMTKTMAITTLFNVTRLDSWIENSPLIDQQYQQQLMLIAMWRF